MNLVVSLSLCALVAAVPMTRINTESNVYASDFDAWKMQHGKVYLSAEEHNHRLSIFQSNAALVEKHNSEGHSFWLEINQFADLTVKEFSDLQTLVPSTLGTQNSTAAFRHAHSGDENPAAVDWRAKGLVNDVKNQGSCGSCWAFSTIVSYEGQVAKKTGKLQSFSEQDLVDCVKDVTVSGQSCCDGCQGGLMDSAFQYMMNKQGGKDELESSYGYTGKDGSCSFSADKAEGVTVTSFTDIAQGSETDLMDAVATVGPVSVAVNANIFWQLYGGGVLSPLFCNGNKLDHGVAAVGYGTDGGKDYWIIRNSWGASWGEKGYVRLSRGSNTCGVSNSAVYPNL